MQSQAVPATIEWQDRRESGCDPLKTITSLEQAGGLPRSQAGSSPQHLLVSLLGEYWFGHDEHVPSAALVDLASDFDVSPTSARAALSRLARRELVESSKDGRKTFYGLTEQAKLATQSELRRILSLGTVDHDWDGNWNVVMFSLPEDRRDVRHLLRSTLRFRGFAPLFDGVWVSPDSDPTAALEGLEELGIENSTILKSSVTHASGIGDPLAAWDLDEVAASYRSFIADFSALREQVATGAISPTEALVRRGAVLDAWSSFPDLDPDLPAAMLPADWPRHEARQVFVDLYDGLGPLAALRVTQVVKQYAEALPDAVYVSTSKDWAAQR